MYESLKVKKVNVWVVLLALINFCFFLQAVVWLEYYEGIYLTI